jgi:PTH1 family peptidyl-tRNA hydrolase
VWVVVGLGNPGREYAATRHNLGFMVVDVLLRRAGARARRGSGDFEAGEVQIASQRVLLVKPTTYVNRTGRAIEQLAAWHPFALEDLLAIVDDVYLPFGRLRLRPDGSAGGHNGLKSMLQTLGGDAFPRLRLGVGQPAGETIALEDWVLGTFPKDERAQLPEFLDRAANAVERIVEVGVERALPAVNSTSPS